MDKNLGQRLTSALLIILMISAFTRWCDQEPESVDTISVVVEETEQEETQTPEMHLTAGVTDAMMQMLVDDSGPTLENVTRDYVQSSYEEEEPETETIEVISDITSTYYVDTWSLNVRSEASADSDIIENLSYGETVEARCELQTEIGDTWAEIITDNGEVGYISTSYLSSQPVVEYIGDYCITYYCACPICCGEWSGLGTSASGVRPQAGRTVAADPSIPFGTRLIINGQEYVVEDRGGAIKGNRIDIYCDSHDECFNHAVETVPVYKEL